MDKIYDKSEIIEKLNSKDVIDFVNKYNITTMIMFGSITNNEFSEESDVDLALLANREIDILYNETDKIYKENENFIHFRKVDVLS